MDTDYAALSQSLNLWINTELGQLVLAQERPYLEQIARECFGEYALELTLFCSPLHSMQHSFVRHHVTLGPCLQAPEAVRCLPEQLPVKTASIDALLLPHTLDFALHPHQVLREVERVLRPEARLIVCGFKPFSLWGAWRMLPFQGRHHPWKGRFISNMRLRDWLSLLGFVVEDIHLLMFRPPWKRMFIHNQMQTWERLGKRFWSRFAGIYILVAIKREITLTPIRPRWKLRSPLPHPSVEPLPTPFSKKLS